MSSFGYYSLNNSTKPFYSGDYTMDHKKFEKLIDLIINENEEQAKALFHDIVVEKSREIYESMMDEEMTDSPVDGLLDEISAEEEGMMEEEDEFAADIEVDDEAGMGDDDMGDMGDDDMGDDDMGGEDDLEDRVVDLEDKLDELMAEFEALMGDEGGDDMGDEDMGDMGDMGDEDMGGEEDDEAMMEAVQLQKVSVTHGDNGAQTKSPTLGANKRVSDNGAKPVKFDQGGDATKGGTQGGLLNPATKDVKGAGQFKNAPGNKNVDPVAAPKPKHGDDGADKRSPVAESRRVAKKIVK
jgi:hypothetical protein